MSATNQDGRTWVQLAALLCWSGFCFGLVAVALPVTVEFVYGFPAMEIWGSWTAGGALACLGILGFGGGITATRWLRRQRERATEARGFDVLAPRGRQ